MEDQLIIKNIIRKKEVGLELLINTYAGLITSIVRKHLGDLQIYEEECVNDVLLAIWDNIKSYDPKQNSLKNWIAAISKYKAIDYKRKYAKNLTNIPLSEAIDPGSIDKRLLQKEIHEELDELLKHLNKNDRDLFTKYYLEEIQLEMIAQNHETSTDNLYNRLSRGRKKLKNIFKKAVRQQ